MNCKQQVRDRLVKIFNNDGPGFRPEIREQGKYHEITDRMVKFIPRSSLVGTILEDQDDYTLVESRGVGMLQHNSYSWKIEEDHFIRAKNMAERKMVRDAALNEWILSLTEEEKHAFVDTLYDVVSASEASNVFEFGADWKNCLQNVFEAAKGIDDTTRKMISGIIRTLFEITGEKAAAELKEKRMELKKEIRSARKRKHSQTTPLNNTTDS